MTNQDARRSDRDERAAPQGGGGDALTAAQRAFARLLGRVLAEKWRNQGRAGSGGHGGPRPDGEARSP
jgi:hypothetical protein